MIEVNCYRWRSWQRRADAIHRKAAALLSDMVHDLGSDDQATDFADNVLAEAEILHSVLSRCAEQSKSPGRRVTPSHNESLTDRGGVNG